MSERAYKVKTRKNYQDAINLYHQATRLLLRTRDLAEGKTDRSATRAYEEVAALDEIIETIQQRMQPFEDDERVQFFMSHIEQLQQDAHNALDSQDYKLMLLNTQYARDLIERVQKRIWGKNTEFSERINQELAQLEADLNYINDLLIAQGENEQAIILLNYARFAKATAKQLLHEQNYRFARQSILVANRFAFAADRLIRQQTLNKISPQNISKKLKRLEEDILIFEINISAAARPDARTYFDHAQKMSHLASENLNKNYYYVANECIEASQSALEKINTIF